MCLWVFSCLLMCKICIYCHLLLSQWETGPHYNMQQHLCKSTAKSNPKQDLNLYLPVDYWLRALAFHRNWKTFYLFQRQNDIFVTYFHNRTYFPIGTNGLECHWQSSGTQGKVGEQWEMGQLIIGFGIRKHTAPALSFRAAWRIKNLKVVPSPMTFTKPL